MDNVEQVLKKVAISSIYRLQAMLHVHPRGIGLITGCPRSATSAVRDWLALQRDVAAVFESRILIGAHRFIDEVERFHTLHRNEDILSDLIRQVVYSYTARTKFIWRKHLVEKEPLEPMAFPDKRYRQFLQNVQLIFPEIKLLFMIRDPVETIWSMTQRQWGLSLTNQAPQSLSVEQGILIWQANAEIVYEYESAQNTYICWFERLVSDPARESQHIFDFLSIRGNRLFRPKQASIPAFSDADREFILRETKPQRELLSSIGMNYG